MLKNLENNGTEKIGLVTPTPGGDELKEQLHIFIEWIFKLAPYSK